MFRGMGGDRPEAQRGRRDVVAARDAASAEKRRREHVWKAERGSEQGGAERLYNKYQDVVGEVRWYNIDEGPNRFEASVATPGVRGNPTILGRYATLDKAKAAVMKELALA
jgi:hypothetical protein